MKTLLLIGGTGFLGKSFFDYLNNSNLKRRELSKIIILARKRKKIKSKVKISFLNQNIKNIKSIPVTDYIIYAANSKNNKENIKGVLNFKNLLNHEHKKTKILFTSSGAVYGKRNQKRKIKETDLVSVKNVQNFTGYKKNMQFLKSKWRSNLGYYLKKALMSLLQGYFLLSAREY
tara:strand:+ start:92 stop:616 length:525 start_codon:yes stop_codon:yes gene_type:complete